MGSLFLLSLRHWALIGWVVSVLGMWGYGAIDKWIAVHDERKACTWQLVTEVNNINEDSKKQIEEARKAADAVVTDPDIERVCNADADCRDGKSSRK